MMSERSNLPTLPVDVFGVEAGKTVFKESKRIIVKQQLFDFKPFNIIFKSETGETVSSNESILIRVPVGSRILDRVPLKTDLTAFYRIAEDKGLLDSENGLDVLTLCWDYELEGTCVYLHKYDESQLTLWQPNNYPSISELLSKSFEEYLSKKMGVVYV